MSTVFPLAALDDRQARARLQRRRHIEQLLEYALPLPPRDRLVLEFVLNRGQSLGQLAALTGSGVSSLQRRFRALCRHLQSPLYRFFFHHHRQLPPDLEHTGRLVFFQRLSLRRAAAAQNLPLFQVRQQLHVLRTLARLRPRSDP